MKKTKKKTHWFEVPAGDGTLVRIYAKGKNRYTVRGSGPRPSWVQLYAYFLKLAIAGKGSRYLGRRTKATFEHWGNQLTDASIEAATGPLDTTPEVESAACEQLALMLAVTEVLPVRRVPSPTSKSHKPPVHDLETALALMFFVGPRIDLVSRCEVQKIYPLDRIAEALFELQPVCGNAAEVILATGDSSALMQSALGYLAATYAKMISDDPDNPALRPLDTDWEAARRRMDALAAEMGAQ